AVSLQCISKSAAAARVHKPIQDKTRAQATLFAFATSIYIHQIYGNISASFFSSAKNGRCMDGEGIATTVFTATADPWTLLTAPAPQDRTLSMPSQLVMNLQSENRTMRIP
ncbi:hypothetical protein, partial [Desulfovibrio inopinatus]|uniref:hypothetical protein n=1 Tax=Desulfovibrio inopinatus TaxID=102109 RepID=UPI0005568B17